MDGVSSDVGEAHTFRVVGPPRRVWGAFLKCIANHRGEVSPNFQKSSISATSRSSLGSATLRHSTKFHAIVRSYSPKTDPQCCGCLARSIRHLGERHCGAALQVVVRRVIFQTPLAEDLCGIRSRNPVCIQEQRVIALRGQLALRPLRTRMNFRGLEANTEQQ